MDDSRLPLRVLLIDDEEDAAILTRRTLAKALQGQFDFDWVTTYDAALEAIQRGAHDIYLCDYRLGDRTGLELIRAAVESGCRTPIILLTGYDDHEIGVEGIRAGAADFLHKNEISPPVLGRTIRYALGQQRSASQLRESHETVQALVEASPLAIVSFDRDSRVRMWNPAAVRVFGWTVAETLGRVNPTVPEEKVEEFRRLKDAGFRGESLVNFESVGPRKDGVRIPVQISTAPLRDASGRVHRVVSIIADITQRKQADEALRESEERTRLILDNALDALVTMDASGRITGWNDAAERMFGWKCEEILTRSLAETVIPPRYREAHGRGLEKFLATGEAVVLNRRVELSGLHRDGHEFPLELTVTATQRRGEYSFSAFVRDLSERAKSEEALRRSEEQLRQAQKMEAIGRLAGGVAHDFNNLLTAIEVPARMLLDELTPNDPMRNDLEEIRSAAGRAAILTRQLLAFSRRQVLQPRVMDLNTVVADMDRMLQRLIGEDIDLVTRLTPRLHPVLADSGQIEQVLVNLAVNARDAMPRGGRVTIETANVTLEEGYTSVHPGSRPGPHAMLAVSDSGSGMDRETLSHLFEPFFTTKELGKGTGLGLATVYGIVKQSGGTIFVYSEPEQGTSFKVYLPSAEGAVGPIERGEATPTSGGTETVLLVEDDRAVRAMARRILEAKGYHVLDAANGDRAVNICETHPERIHIMVSDVIMPRVSGRILSDRISQLRPEMKVLFMSGYPDETIVQHGVLQPGTAFLEKPFTPEKLVAKVRQVLDAI